MRSKYITQRNGWTFRKGCIEKHNFYASKDPIDVNDDDIEHLVASNKYPIEKKTKYFIDYSTHSYDHIKPLCVNLHKPYGPIKSLK